MRDHLALEADLLNLRLSLPEGTSLDWERGHDGIHLTLVDVPGSRRGSGTPLLAAFLEIADRHGEPVHLDADSTDEPGDPSTFELVRWYARFGFVPLGANDQGWIEMHRTPRPPREPGAVLRDYQAVKANADLTMERYEAALSEPGRTGRGPGHPFSA